MYSEKYVDIIYRLKVMENPRNVEGMARFGINPDNTLGISIPVLKKMAKECGKNHTLALELWDSGIHEARILAAMVEDPQQTTSEQLDQWAKGFDSWDVCDQCCKYMFAKTPFVLEKINKWSVREETFVKRAGFVLIAELAVHDSKAQNARFLGFLELIKQASDDERNFVKKAVNWALRQIGKRNRTLNQAAINTAIELKSRDSKSARWIAADALRELSGEAVQNRLMNGFKR
ncbi:MAG: DNA alkylation repair protein [Acidobacteriota bacterium]